MKTVDTSTLKKVTVPTPSEKQKSLQKPGKKKLKKDRSKLQVRKDNPNSKLWKRKAMTAWGKYAHKRFKYCAICGKHENETPLQAHHLISRAKTLTRNDPENCIMLCYTHHKGSAELSAHEGQLGFLEWLEENMPHKIEYMKANRYRTGKTDYREAYHTLTEAME